MDIFLQLFIFGLSLAVVIKGADWFTDAAVWFAETYRIPKVIIGATVISLSTTMPELTVSAYSAYMGNPEIALGNVVGSVICNIGLIMGIALIIKPYKTGHDLFMHKGVFMLGAGLMMTAVSIDGLIAKNDAFVLITLLAGYVYYSLQVTKAQDMDKKIADEMRAEKLETALRSIFNREYQIGFTVKFLVGAAMVIIGGRIMVDSGITVATLVGVPESIIALTMVAIGTSLPELVTSIAAATKGHLDLSVGNIIGANILNMTWVIGVSAFLNPIAISADMIRMDLPVMIGLVTLVLVFGRSKNSLERWEGWLFLIGYFAFISFRLMTGMV